MFVLLTVLFDVKLTHEELGQDSVCLLADCVNRPVYIHTEL